MGPLPLKLVPLSVAAAHGAERAVAETDVTNLASQRVLLKAGFAETGRTATTVSFARELQEETEDMTEA